MKKTKNIALILGVIILSLTLSYFVIAWTEPTAEPPAENIKAPINVGTNSQAKEGGLVLGTNSTAVPNYGLIVQHGNVGIGTGITTPAARLEVTGNIIAADPINDNHVATQGWVLGQAVGRGGRLGVWTADNQTRLGDFVNAPVPWTCTNTSFSRVDGMITSLTNHDCMAVGHNIEILFQKRNCSGRATVRDRTLIHHNLYRHPLKGILRIHCYHAITPGQNCGWIQSEVIESILSADGVCTNFAPHWIMESGYFEMVDLPICGGGDGGVCRIR